LLNQNSRTELIVFPSASVPLRCRLCAVTLEREGGDKSIGFLDLSRERKGQEAEGGRAASAETACCLLPTPHPPLLSSTTSSSSCSSSPAPSSWRGGGEPFVPIVVCRQGASCLASWIQSAAHGARGWISTAPLVIRGELLSPDFYSCRA